jgi:hypothetical protein
MVYRLLHGVDQITVAARRFDIGQARLKSA